MSMEDKVILTKHFFLYIRPMKKHIVTILLSLFVGLFFVTYNYTENISPRGLLLVAQMLSLWFLLRIFVLKSSKISNVLILLLIIWGGVEAMWGLGQLYDFLPAGHSIFKITGSFFNPGPYGGFIAVILPFTLHYWLFFRGKKNFIQYPLLLVIILCILILPATLSRTAWIACLLGCLAVGAGQDNIKLQLNGFKQRNKKFILIGIILISILLMGIGYMGYNLKRDSANGRIFMWKISVLAIKETPLVGGGLGSFPKRFANAQENYFKQNLATENEKNVAGSPEYAFNEYLRILVEQGFVGLLIFLAISFLIIGNGVKNNQWGATGGFISLCVFAFASYPYYLWQFLLIWILLGVLCLGSSKEKTEIFKNNIYQKYITLGGFILLCIFFGYTSFLQYDFYKAEKKWKNLSFLYATKIHNGLQKNYQDLYPMLNANPKFIFEYASTLNASKQYKKANECIKRGLLLSCDPMFYNLQGRNYHEMGNYNESEKALINSINLLPKRIYPYYLLTKLYADTSNYQPKKMKWAAYKVLEETPKVQSQAIDEMRKEVKAILKEKNEK